LKKSFDVWTLLAIVGLSAFGLFNLFGIEKGLFLNQASYFLVGFLFLFIFYKIRLEFFKVNSSFFYFLGLFLLVISFFIAPEIRGAKRWINFYFLKFQPAEFLKVFFIIYLADFFSREAISRTSFSQFDLRKILSSFFFVFLPVAIIFKQPDLGNSVIYIIVYLGMLFFTDLPLRNFAYLLFLMVIFMPIAWRILVPYQQNRILTFINPGVDPEGTSYNLIQSIITIGSGGLFGRGLGLGKQSRLAFLPENHTDFAFASLVEQFGFFGGVAVIALYGLIIFRLIKKTPRFSKERFNFLFLMAVILLLVFQIFINIGMNLGILPITGIALPLISYGGSSILSTLMILGLTLSL
jgi:rod shape determining protein RodA